MITQEFLRYLKSTNIKTYIAFKQNFSNLFIEKYKTTEWFKCRQKVFFNKKQYSISDYIHYGFVWEDTPEGDDFWMDLQESIERKTHTRYKTTDYILRND